MMGKRYLYALKDCSVFIKGGSKAKNLHFLIRHGFAVPPGWVVSWDALSDYQIQSDAVLAVLRRELAAKLDPEHEYALRSSASIEDDDHCSCAGLFLSILKVKGVDQILKSIQAVWQSLESAEYNAYRLKNPGLAVQPRMAVIIQEMIPAIFSGIVFSKNPITGLSETIIEVGRGTGDELAAARHNPERWISKWGNWLQRPDPGLISEELARAIVSQAGSAARQYGRPVDLEWAYDGQSLYFLQVRPITQLDIPVFSHRIAREMLPGIIKPLVWSVNTRLINQIWADILKKLTGSLTYRPEELTGHFYYRAYINMTVFGRVFERLGMPYEALELLFGLEHEGPDKPRMRPGAGILARLPYLAAFVFRFIWIEWSFKRLLKEKQSKYQNLVRQMKPGLTAAEWLDMARRVFDETIPVAYFNIMIPMLAMMYFRLLASMLKKHGYDARSLEMSGVSAVKDSYNPRLYLEKLRDKYRLWEHALDPEAETALEQDIKLFLEQYGHFSDSGNDCSSIPWRENPALIRQMLAQPGIDRKIDHKTLTFKDLILPRSRRAIIYFVYRRACRFAVYREMISSLYTFGYGQFRPCFVNLGEQFAVHGIIENKEDVFYLYWQELQDLVNNPVISNQQSLVERRSQDIAEYRDAVLPDLIFGLEQPPVQKECPVVLHGIPTSLGTYTGPARILKSLMEFERLNNGDVLVIPYSDVGWTPLFARAGAVVAESGGILSHSSIVAREYRIPAVVSAPGACRIVDGTIITVNGYTGDILMS
jgi:phosphohistidine swiveling domain-containing protein